MRPFNRGSARRERPQLALVRTFQSEAAEIGEARVPLVLRFTLIAFAVMIAVLAITTSFFSIDRVVTSTFGQIVTTDPTVVLQPLDPSIIKSIKVQEGEKVKAGQLLASLDSTFAEADVASLRLQLSSLDAEIARCEAELADKPFTFVPGDGPSAQLYADLQRANYNQRKAQFDAQVHAYDEQVAQANATIVRVKNDEKEYSEREKLSVQLETIRSQLVSKQLDSIVNLLQTSDQKTEIRRNLEADENSLVETQHFIESTVATRDAFIQQWYAQDSTQLVTSRNSYDAAKQLLEKAQKHKELVRLEAPDDAIVLRVAKLSVGSVLQQGEPFIELALLRSPVEAEIYIDPRDVGFVRPGDDTTIKLDSFHFVEHGWADGKLRWVSQGTFVAAPQSTGGTVMPVGTAAGGDAAVSGQNSQPAPPGSSSLSFYKARVTLTNVDLKNVPNDVQLLPGMTLTADIHVGTRSLFWYLVRGIVRGFDEAMREP